MIRYRSSMCRFTGRLLTGFPVIEQAIGRILTTRLMELVMLLAFGSDLLRFIGRNIHTELVVKIYTEVVTAVHRWEPEYRIQRIQLVRLERTGTLGIAFVGTYYPEGRHGNYSISQPAGFVFDSGRKAA